MAVLGTFVAGQILTAAELNAISTWTTFTPSWTNLTVGNGTNTGRYSTVNKIMYVQTSFTMGSTSAMGTNPRLTLPASATMDTTAQAVFGTSTIEDTGTATFVGVCFRSTTTGIEFYVNNVSATYQTLTSITSTVPMTWTNTDRLITNFWVQLA